MKANSQNAAQAPGICTSTLWEWQVPSHAPGVGQTLDMLGAVFLCLLTTRGWVKLL